METERTNRPKNPFGLTLRFHIAATAAAADMKILTRGYTTSLFRSKFGRNFQLHFRLPLDMFSSSGSRFIIPSSASLCCWLREHYIQAHVHRFKHQMGRESRNCAIASLYSNRTPIMQHISPSVWRICLKPP